MTSPKPSFWMTAASALQFEETVPAAPIPFDQVRDKVAEARHKDQLGKALSDRAVAIKTAVEGGASHLARHRRPDARDCPQSGALSRMRRKRWWMPVSPCSQARCGWWKRVISSPSFN